MAAVTLLYMTAIIPAGDIPFIPARILIFPNHGLWDVATKGKEVHPGTEQAQIYGENPGAVIPYRKEILSPKWILRYGRLNTGHSDAVNTHLSDKLLSNVPA